MHILAGKWCSVLLRVVLTVWNLLSRVLNGGLISISVWCLGGGSYVPSVVQL